MKVKRITVVAILVALNLVLSYFGKIPTATGFVSLVETGIVLAAWLYGPQAGMIVGGMTGFLLDLLAGYPQWMFFSLVIHGGEGYVFGRVRTKWLASGLGLLVMVVGYWLAGAVLLSVIAGGKLALGGALIAAAAGIPGNILQVAVGLVLATVVYRPVASILGEK
jgi:uncharacterized membrane protein